MTIAVHYLSIYLFTQPMETHVNPTSNFMPTTQSWQLIQMLMHGKGVLHVITDGSIVQNNIFYITHH